MIITVLNLKFAHDSRHICCLGQTKNYTLMVFLIDSVEQTILGTMDLIYSVPFKIRLILYVLNNFYRDMCFFPNMKYSFVTCGL